MPVPRPVEFRLRPFEMAIPMIEPSRGELESLRFGLRTLLALVTVCALALGTAQWLQLPLAAAVLFAMFLSSITLERTAPTAARVFFVLSFLALPYLLIVPLAE